MAVSRADKETELQRLRKAFKGADSAILVDYRGLNVPQVTELRRQLRTGRATYRVVKNTLARRALKGTSFEPLAEFFAGTTAVAYTGDDPVALAKTLTTFAKTAPALTIKAAVSNWRCFFFFFSSLSSYCSVSRLLASSRVRWDTGCCLRRSIPRGWRLPAFAGSHPPPLVAVMQKSPGKRFISAIPVANSAASPD